MKLSSGLSWNIHDQVMGRIGRICLCSQLNELLKSPRETRFETSARRPWLADPDLGKASASRRYFMFEKYVVFDMLLAKGSNLFTKSAICASDFYHPSTLHYHGTNALPASLITKTDQTILSDRAGTSRGFKPRFPHSFPRKYVH